MVVNWVDYLALSKVGQWVASWDHKKVPMKVEEWVLCLAEKRVCS